jgi:hypothetical protein
VSLALDPGLPNQLNVGGCLNVASKVGIGMTPNYALDVLSTSYNVMSLRGTTDHQIQYYMNSGSTFTGQDGGGASYRYFQNNTEDKIRFYQGAGGALVLQPVAGNVGIGTTAPGYKLHVSGAQSIASITTAPYTSQIVAENSTAGRLYMGYGYTAGTGSKGYIQASEYYSSIENTQQLLLNPNGGNVGIGTTNPTYALHVGGPIKTQNYYFRFYGVNNAGFANGAWVGLEADSTTPYYAAGYTQTRTSGGTFFQAPVSGIYQLNWIWNLTTNGAGCSWYTGMIKSTSSPGGFTFSTSIWNGNSNILTTVVGENAAYSLYNGSISYAANLSAGDKIWLVVAMSTAPSNASLYSWGGSNCNTFTGYLVSAI